MIIALHPRRAYLQSYWVVLCVTSGSTVSLLSIFMAGSAMIPWIMGGAVILALVGYAYPAVARRPYRIFYQGFERYARLMRFCLKLVCFFLVFVAVGRAGSTLQLRRREQDTMWMPRGATPVNEFGSEYEGKPEFQHRHWLSAYVRWARTSHNEWAVMLLPFLMLLSRLEPEEEHSFPENIYTLF